MHDFTELDRNINLNKPENYHLSIQLSPDGFSFCILETYIGRYVGVKHYHFKKSMYFDQYMENIYQIINTDPLLKCNYHSTSLMSVSDKALLIPEEIFEKDTVKEYFSVHEDLGELHELHYNYIPNFKTYNVFSQHHELLNLFRQSYHDVGIFHQWTSLLLKPDLEETILKTKAVVNFNDQFFDFVVIKENKLLLCNKYFYKNENDFVFYLLNVFKQLKIDSNECEIVIMGNTQEKNRYFELLGKFVTKYEISGPGDWYSYSPALKNISKPYFYNLYNLHRCVSLEESTEG